MDSTGIKFLDEGEWKCKKHGSVRRCQWRKLHIGIDARTLQIRAICVTSNNVPDAAVIADLLHQLPEGEVLESLTRDGAYGTQSVQKAVMRRGAIPVIPPRKNARIRKGVAFVYRNAAIAACRRFGMVYMEALERQSPQKFGGNQNELHQETGKASDFTHL